MLLLLLLLVLALLYLCQVAGRVGGRELLSIAAQSLPGHNKVKVRCSGCVAWTRGLSKRVRLRCRAELGAAAGLARRGVRAQKGVRKGRLITLLLLLLLWLWLLLLLLLLEKVGTSLVSVMQRCVNAI